MYKINTSRMPPRPTAVERFPPIKKCHRIDVVFFIPKRFCSFTVQFPVAKRLN